MDFSLTPEQEKLRDRVRAFVEAEAVPTAGLMDAEDRFPEELIPRLADLGLMAARVSARFGGRELDTVSYAVALEELGRGSATVAAIVAVNNMAVEGLNLFGSESQKEKYLPGMSRGEIMGCFALSEPQAGSDALAIQTRAEATDDGIYRLNGRKCFITNGTRAFLAVVFAVTDPEKGKNGITAFLCEKSRSGVGVGRVEEKMGLNGIDVCELFFRDVPLTTDDVLGKPGEGFRIAMTILDTSRIGIAAQSLGIGRAALEAAAGHARERKQFGRAIAEFQPIQWMLADSAVELAAARLLTWQAAWLLGEKRPAAKQAAQAKLAASETANRIATRAVQIFGGHGYLKPCIAERLFRDARITTIYEGTSEIQRLVIAREELR